MMKQIFKYIIISMLFFTACDQEEFTGTGLESLRDFSLDPIPGQRLELNSIRPSDNVVVSWSEAESGLNSEVIYEWIAYTDNVSSPLLSSPSDNEGRAASLTFTNSQLDEFLASQGLGVGEEITFNWTVVATNGDITKLAESNSLTLKRFVDAVAPFNLTSPADEALLELNFEAPDSEIVITWEESFSGLGNDITYTWVADAEGGDFSDPILEVSADDMGAASQVTFTHQELEDVLEAQGVPVAGFISLDWKVVATTGEVSAESNVNTVQLRRFNPVQAKFLVGAATPGGWSWDAPTEIIEVSEGVFQGTLAFTNEAFRVFDTRDDWGSGTNFPGFADDGYNIDARFENAMDGDQNFRFIGAPGEYTFTLDTNNKEIRLTVGPSIFLVGAATPGGWSWDAPTEAFQVESGVFKSTLAFSNEAFRFFTSNGDWGSGLNYPHYENEGFTIDANFENAGDGDSNFRFIGTPGTYTITVDNNNKTITLE